MKTSNNRKIKYEFAPYGTAAPLNLEDSSRIYLDVGGDLRAGVVDHHQFKNFQGAAAHLVVRHPEFVRQAVGSETNKDLTFVVHCNPDLDAAASVALALDVLVRDPDSAMRRMAEYVDKVDSGRLGADPANPFSLYSAFAQLGNKTSEVEPDRIARWTRLMETGQGLVRHVLKEARLKGLPIEEIDAFSCSDVLGPEDRDYVKSDPARYAAKLKNPLHKAIAVRLNLPKEGGGQLQFGGLMARNVRNDNVNERVLFFKDWARTDCIRNPEENGFSLLCLTEEGAVNGNAACWVSVRPEDGVSLVGLGRLLEEAEVNARLRKHDKDSRWDDQVSGKKRTERQGYDNPDPWYDGRGHDYKILQSPNEGTELSADEIEDIVIEYGAATNVVQLFSKKK